MDPGAVALVLLTLPWVPVLLVVLGLALVLGMAEHMGGETFRLDLRALPGDVPVANRLRIVLKRLLRQHGFRCTRVVETTPELPPRNSHQLPRDATAAPQVTPGPTDAATP